MQSLPRKLLFAGTTLALIVMGFMVVKSAKPKSLSQQPQEQDSLVAAVRRGGLREAARIKGQYVGTERTSGLMKYDLGSLTEKSSIIVVGTPFTSSSSLSSSGERIVTEYKLRIDQTLKGKLKHGPLSVIVPGGKVTFDDGTSAEINTPDLGPIEEEKRYVLFLTPSDEVSDSFALVGGGQGIFELSSSDSVVKPLGDKVDVVQKHKNQQASSFLEEIKAAAKKFGKTQSCN
jgi:hypothetical protein